MMRLDLNPSDILAYLVVLSYGPVLDKLSWSELKTGHANLLGCLMRLYDALENENYSHILELIRYREMLNGEFPRGDPMLEEETADLANLLYGFLRTSPDQELFLKKWDEEIAKILQPEAQCGH